MEIKLSGDIYNISCSNDTLLIILMLIAAACRREKNIRYPIYEKEFGKCIFSPVVAYDSYIT